MTDLQIILMLIGMCLIPFLFILVWPFNILINRHWKKEFDKDNPELAQLRDNDYSDGTAMLIFACLISFDSLSFWSFEPILTNSGI